MTTTLKDGTQVEDPRLDRLVEFDERSREYPIRTAVTRNQVQYPRSRAWRRPALWTTNQGREGACVGHTKVNVLRCLPAPHLRFRNQEHANAYAQDVYHQAQHIDPWTGCSLGRACPIDSSTSKYDGTSVLAGLKVAVERGHIEGYRWGFTVEERLAGLSWKGPASLGLVWRDGCYETDADGWLDPTAGDVVGGHNITWRAQTLYLVRGRIDFDRSFGRLLNSWGPTFGKNGEAKVSLRKLFDWLDEDGESAFVEGRQGGLVAA